MKQKAPPMRKRLVSGGLLIFLGLFFLFINRSNVGGEIVVAVLGTAFLVWFALTQEYGLLIPGAILTGLGIGIIIEGVTDPNGAAIMIALGCGFSSIYVVDRLMGNRRPAGWWPLIPGSIQLAIGLSLAAESVVWLRQIGRYWPLLLVLIGGYIVLKSPKPALKQSPESDDNKGIGS